MKSRIVMSDIAKRMEAHEEPSPDGLMGRYWADRNTKNFPPDEENTLFNLHQDRKDTVEG
jgi:hypothetical protein